MASMKTTGSTPPKVAFEGSATGAAKSRLRNNLASGGAGGSPPAGSQTHGALSILRLSDCRSPIVPPGS